MEAHHNNIFHWFWLQGEWISSLFSTFLQTPAATHWTSFLRGKHFSPTALFFVATDAYGRSLCEFFFRVANVNRLLSVNHVNVAFFKQLFWASEHANCFSQLFSSVSSNQDHGEKWLLLQQTMLLGSLNDKFVAGLLDLIPVRLYHGHNILSACAHDLPLRWLRSVRWVRILITYISQSSVVAPLRCGEIFIDRFIANLLENVPVKEFQKSVNIWWRYREDYGVSFFIDSQCSNHALTR